CRKSPTSWRRLRAIVSVTPRASDVRPNVSSVGTRPSFRHGCLDSLRPRGYLAAPVPRRSGPSFHVDGAPRPMQLLAPDVLAEAQGLSVAVTVTGLVAGLLVWLYGWRWHRFWTVLGATLLAGVLGLYSAPTYGVQPLVGGLLLAVAAGALALSLVRMVA